MVDFHNISTDSIAFISAGYGTMGSSRSLTIEIARLNPNALGDMSARACASRKFRLRRQVGPRAARDQLVRNCWRVGRQCSSPWPPSRYGGKVGLSQCCDPESRTPSTYRHHVSCLVCVNAAVTDLRGGRSVMVVPTATMTPGGSGPTDEVH